MRLVGQGAVNPVLHQEIVAWAQLHGHRVRPWEARALGRMDVEFRVLTQQRIDAEAAADRTGVVADPSALPQLTPGVMRDTGR